MNERYTHIWGSDLWLLKIASASYCCSVCTNQVGTYNVLVTFRQQRNRLFIFKMTKIVPLWTSRSISYLSFKTEFQFVGFLRHPFSFWRHNITQLVSYIHWSYNRFENRASKRWNDDALDWIWRQHNLTCIINWAMLWNLYVTFIIMILSHSICIYVNHVPKE